MGVTPFLAYQLAESAWCASHGLILPESRFPNAGSWNIDKNAQQQNHMPVNFCQLLAGCKRGVGARTALKLQIINIVKRNFCINNFYHSGSWINSGYHACGLQIFMAAVVYNRYDLVSLNHFKKPVQLFFTLL